MTTATDEEQEAPEAIEVKEMVVPDDDEVEANEADANEIWPGTAEYPNSAGYTNHQASTMADYWDVDLTSPIDPPPELPLGEPEAKGDNGTDEAPTYTEGETIDIDELTVDELKAELDARGVEYTSSDRKADLQQKLAESG